MSKSSILSDDFNRKIISIERTRSKMEKLFSQRHLNRKEIEQIYSILFLNVFTFFENFLEELFIGLLCGKVRSSSKVYPKIFVKSSVAAREVVFQDRNYFNWLPYKNTKNMAECYFRKGYPFLRLTKNDIQILEEMHVVRNAIAHKSRSASKKLETEIFSNISLLQREKTPGGYLRSIFRTAPQQSRFENYVITLSSYAIKLAR